MSCVGKFKVGSGVQRTQVDLGDESQIAGSLSQVPTQHLMKAPKHHSLRTHKETESLLQTKREREETDGRRRAQYNKCGDNTTVIITQIIPFTV